MTNNLKFRFIVIAAVVLVCAYGIIGIPKSVDEIKANWKHNIHLGLDLSGGSELVIQIQIQDAFKATADDTINKMKDAMRKVSMGYTDINRNDPQTIAEADTIQINVTGIPPTKAGDFRSLVNQNFGDVWILTPVNQTDFKLTMKPTEALTLKQATLTQSISTITNKVNGLGLTEASVQPRQRANADAEILVQLPGVDDSAHIKDTLKTQAILALQAVIGGPSYPSKEAAMAAQPGGILPLNAMILPGKTKGGAAPDWYVLNRTPKSPGATFAMRHQSRGLVDAGKLPLYSLKMQPSALSCTPPERRRSTAIWRSYWTKSSRARRWWRVKSATRASSKDSPAATRPTTWRSILNPALCRPASNSSRRPWLVPRWETIQSRKA